MSFRLWNLCDSTDIESLVTRYNLNRVKFILYPIDEGYEVFIKINDKEESMYFTYQDSRVLDSLDYGVLPTPILSGICQAKEQYLYSNYVIAEVIDRRCGMGNEFWKNGHENHSSEKKYFAVMRITDNSIVKLTGIKSRMGDLREEQQWVSKKAYRLNLDTSSDSQDGYGFMDSEWFQDLILKKHVSVVQRRKHKARWNNDIDGKFHPDFLHQIQHTRLKRHVENSFNLKKCASNDEIPVRQKIQLTDDMMDKVFKLLESQKQTIFKMNSGVVMKYNDCHEECVHQMIIRSPLSGSNFKLILSRCPLHNRHWGHLIVDQWEGSSTKPIRFQLPGGFGQGRRLLNQLSEMLGARISMNVESNPISDTNNLDQNISPKLSEVPPSSKCPPNDTIWESIESIMTKNIQSGKPLYDNRDNTNIAIATNANEAYNSLKKKKSANNINRNKLSSNNNNNNQDTVFQMPSKNNALLKAAGMNGEPQQKQSLYSLKDLNLDDLF